MKRGLTLGHEVDPFVSIFCIYNLNGYCDFAKECLLHQAPGIGMGDDNIGKSDKVIPNLPAVDLSRLKESLSVTQEVRQEVNVDLLQRHAVGEFYPKGAL